jgi:hypothetical protein
MPNGAGIERGHFVLLRVAHSQHDHRDVGSGAQRAAGLEAAHARHVHIEQHQAGRFTGEHLDRLLAGARFDHLVAVPDEGRFHHAADLRIVVHHQDFSGAQLSLPPAAASVK